MATNVFTAAKAYSKKHPRTSWQDCIKAVSGKKKKAPANKAPARRVGSGAKKVVAKKTIVKRTTTTKINGIGGDATNELIRTQREFQKQENIIGALRNKLAGASAADKKAIRADIAKRKQYVATLKKNKTSIKRFI
jgi:hypothetical protein